MDGKDHSILGKWDMIIAFPPCTHLAVSGAAWFERKRNNGDQRKGIEFFCKFLNADCEKIVIENPIGIISGDYIPKWFPDLAEKYSLPQKPTQVIQPWMFGDNATKSTCLWIKGLNQLVPDITDKPEFEYHYTKSGKRMEMWMYNVRCQTVKDGLRAKLASKTFPGIANAMAKQWVEYILNETNLSEVTHMEKWPEDCECDGQLSLFPVDFSKCMNPPETEQQYNERIVRSMEQKDEQVQSDA